MLTVKLNTPSSRFVTVGSVRKSHGLYGEVLVAFRAGASSDVLLGKKVWIAPPIEGISESSFLEITPFGNRHRVRLEHVDFIDAASQAAGASLIMDPAELGAHAITSMDTSAEQDSRIGLSVSAEVYGDLGTITEILVTGANDVLVVEGPYGEVLLPEIPDVVLETDFVAGTMRVFVLDGLIDTDRQD